MHREIEQFISSKFKFWSFIAMFLLVFVHGYNLQIRYLQPWTVPGEPMNFTSFTEYLLANGLFRFRIPMLFIISGYLFALHDEKPHKERVAKRFRTLVVPYLIWSAIGIAFTYGLELTLFGKNLVSSSHVVQIDNTRLLLHDYHWYELLVRWLFIPVPYQLWFIRVLFIYNLAYPAIRWCVLHRTGRWFFFGFAFLLWLNTTSLILIEGEGLLFFSLGIWIMKSGFPINKPKQWLRPMWWGIAFVLLATLKTLLAFIGQEYLGNAVFPLIIILHKLVIFSGLITCWFGFDPLVRWCMSRRWFVWLTAFAFIIYAMHTPIIAYFIDSSLRLINGFPGAQFIAYLSLSIIIITFCILSGALIRLLLPKVYGTLTGGRGF